MSLPPSIQFQSSIHRGALNCSAPSTHSSAHSCALLSGQELIEFAERLAHIGHAGKMRECGEASVTHSERVATGVGSIIEDQFRCAAIAAAWLHDLIEDCEHFEVYRTARGKKEGKLCLEELLLGPDAPAGATLKGDLESEAGQVCYLVDRLTNKRRTYKEYVDGLLDVKGISRNSSIKEKLDAIAVVVKMVDRKDNTKVDEKLDTEAGLREYRQLGASIDLETEEGQRQLLSYYKKKDILLLIDDAEKKIIRWYDSRRRLKYDEKQFGRSIEQRFAIKISSNAVDNLNLFVGHAARNLLYRSEFPNEVIKMGEFWSLLYEICVNSLLVLERRNGGVTDINHYIHKVNDSDGARRALGCEELLVQIRDLYKAYRFGLRWPNGRKVEKDDWQKPVLVGADVLQSMFEPPLVRDRTFTRRQKRPKPLVPALPAWDAGSSLAGWAENVAGVLHGDLYRESGRPQHDRDREVAALVSTILQEPYKDVGEAAAWLCDVLPRFYPRIDVTRRDRKGKKPSATYFQDLLHGAQVTKPLSSPGKLLYMLNRMAPRSASYHEHSHKLLTWRMDDPPPLEVITGIIRLCERVVDLRDLLALDPELTYERMLPHVRTAKPVPGEAKAVEQQRLYELYKRFHLLDVTEDVEGKPICLYDLDGNLIFDEDMIRRAAVKWHLEKVASFAAEFFYHELPQIDQKAVYTLPLEADRGHGVANYSALWALDAEACRLVFEAFEQQKHLLEKMGLEDTEAWRKTRRGVEDINDYMRMAPHRRSSLIEKDLQIKTALAAMRRCKKAADEQLLDSMSMLVMQPDAWKQPPMWSIKEANFPFEEGFEGEGDSPVKA